MSPLEANFSAGIACSLFFSLSEQRGVEEKKKPMNKGRKVLGSHMLYLGES